MKIVDRLFGWLLVVGAPCMPGLMDRLRIPRATAMGIYQVRLPALLLAR